MKAVLDDTGVPWGFGETAEKAKTDAIDQIMDLPKDQLREFIQTLVEDFMVREFSTALVDKFKSGDDEVEMVAQGRAFYTREEAEARKAQR
jgi:hypothetical protein